VFSVQGFSVQEAEDAVAQVACQLIAAILLGCEVIGIQDGFSFLNSHMKLKVSFLIKLAALQASGGAEH
jgi:hypothetical protein